MQVIRYDRIELKLDAKRRRDGDGALVVPGRFARTGLQSYEQGDGTSRIECRFEEDVKASAPSFAGVAITDEHPMMEMISPKNWRLHARGHVESPTFVDGWVEGLFVINDGDLAQKIEAGERPELSAGYYADFIEEPGEWEGQPFHGRQANILGNHVATLPDGMARAGREARLRLDSTGNQIRPGLDADDRDHRDREKERNMNDIEITVGGITYQVKADSAAGQALRQELTRVSTLEKDLETMRAKADSKEEEIAALKEQIAAAEAKIAELEDPEKMEEAVESRSDLIDKARKLVGPKVDTKGTDQEIKVRVLTALGVKDAATRPEAYVDARFDLECERAATPPTGPTLADLADIATPQMHNDGNSSDPFAVLDDALNGYCDHAMGRREEVS